MERHKSKYNKNIISISWKEGWISLGFLLDKEG